MVLGVGNTTRLAAGFCDLPAVGQAGWATAGQGGIAKYGTTAMAAFSVDFLYGPVVGSGFIESAISRNRHGAARPGG